MPTPLEAYYLKKPEPYQSCLLALKQLVLSIHPEIVHERKFQIPFFSYKGKKLGYLWLNGRKLMLGFCIDKSLLVTDPPAKPKDQYESIRIDPNADLPVELIVRKFKELLNRIDIA